MAGSVNKVILVGNLGADPEVRVLSSGTKTARLRIATSETYTNRNGERVTNTEWHTVNVWRGQAEVAEKYLSKGRQIYVEGKLRTRSYDDKDGITRYVTEIEADSFTMLGGGRDDSQGGGGGGSYEPAQQPQQQASSSSKPAANLAPDSENDETFDDLPF